MKDVNEMTLDECRDEIARAQGWRWIVSHEIGPLGWEGPDGVLTSVTHPIPATLDAIAASLPEGWRWTEITTEGIVKWFATAYALERERGEVCRRHTVGAACTELLARARCSVSAHRAKGVKHG